MSANADDELEAKRLEEPFVGRGAQPFAPDEQYPQHYETLRSAAETVEAPEVKTKAQSVEEILLKLSGGDADYGIQPRDGGFALVKTVPPVDDRLDYYGVPAQEPLVWAPTLEGIQDRILLLDDAASIAARTGAAEWSEETIKEDPWTAVYLPPPDLERTDIAVLRKGLMAARECADSADDELAGEMAEARTVLLAETIMGRLERGGLAAEAEVGIAEAANQNERGEALAAPPPMDPPPVAEAPRQEFSFESIARDHWSAVNDAIPERLSDELLLAARKAVARCVDESFPVGLPPFGAGPMEGAGWDFNAAMDRDEALTEIARERALSREPDVETYELAGEEARDAGADYIRKCGEAYQRDFDNRPWWSSNSAPPKSLTLPEPQNAAEQLGLKTYLETFEEEFGYRPEFVFEGSLKQETPAASVAPEQAASSVGEPERAAAEAIVEAPRRDKNFLSGWFIARSASEHLARVADLVLDTIVGYFVDEPKLTPQQVHDTLQASGDAGNLEVIAAREAADVAAENRAAHEDRMLLMKAGQQEKDVYLSMMLGTPATAEANLGRDEHERVREEQRSEDQSEGQRYRGHHL